MGGVKQISSNSDETKGKPSSWAEAQSPIPWGHFVYRLPSEEYNTEFGGEGVIRPIPPQPGNPDQHQ